MEVPIRKRDEILHEGEMEAQRRFGVEAAWDDERLDGMFRTEIPERAAQFIESLPFFSSQPQPISEPVIAAIVAGNAILKNETD